ncbi:adhesion G protein-coupled receptor L1-like isoform X1 [Lates japonicus]|uniref:Adhesion G protein-coupled receptor L1-like isoform X1 n=1 Tax=Lates japonicus TaxID=270547 RepID=A0AAD3MSY4_LATJO|nr:adhesion G protein-coupled receptor L1-like isoform X1 [Lates japonicus]
MATCVWRAWRDDHLELVQSNLRPSVPMPVPPGRWKPGEASLPRQTLSLTATLFRPHPAAPKRAAGLMQHEHTPQLGLGASEAAWLRHSTWTGSADATLTRRLVRTRVSELEVVGCLKMGTGRGCKAPWVAAGSGTGGKRDPQGLG